MGEGGFFGLVPVGETGTYGFAGIESARFAEPVAGRLERFAGFGGPVVLIGDAAHATPPHMGQGGALAIEDALVLAELLAGGGSPAEFEARRRPRAAWVSKQSRIAAGAWLLPPAVRDAVLRERRDALLRERYAPLVAAR